jgi:FkbM family methyltransferase
MGNVAHIDPPFGHFSLPAKREALRLSAWACRDTRVGRWKASLARKRAIKGFGVKARLYPSTNRCEKRALCGVDIWDYAEREALRAHIASSTQNRPYVFLDVGANVGLYSLFASAYAAQLGRDIRTIAIEPSVEMGARLCVNAAASRAKIELYRFAITAQAGEVFLSDGGGNRGEGQISSSGEPVNALTLLQFCDAQDVTRLDALKLDIEGQDLAVLTQFFAQAPEGLHPKMMILEIDETSRDPLIELAGANNYLITTRTRMNIVVTKRDQT